MRYGGSRGILPQDSGGEVGEEAVDEGSSRVNEQTSFAVKQATRINEKLEYKASSKFYSKCAKTRQKVTLPFSRLSIKGAIF